MNENSCQFICCGLHLSEKDKKECIVFGEKMVFCKKHFSKIQGMLVELNRIKNKIDKSIK